MWEKGREVCAVLHFFYRLFVSAVEKSTQTELRRGRLEEKQRRKEGGKNSLCECVSVHTACTVVCPGSLRFTPTGVEGGKEKRQETNKT